MSRRETSARDYNCKPCKFTLGVYTPLSYPAY